MTKYSFDEEGVAFYFFIATLVGFYVIPTTFRLLWPKKVLEHDKEPNCSCSKCAAKRTALRKLHTANVRWRMPRMILLGALWMVFMWAFWSAWRAKVNFKAYDPFSILGVSSGASEEEIRGAFKNLSRKWHPDKATGDDKAKAEEKFVEISKAYKALTDEKIRRNWEEYGNPDGIRTFALGVALPSWLVSSSNRLIVLAVYCIAFGVGLPLLVKQWWSKSKKYTKDGIRHKSMAMFYREVKEASTIKKLVELIATANEFEEELKPRPTDSAAMEALLEQINKPSEGKTGISDSISGHYESPKKTLSTATSKAHLLLFAHLHRIPIEDEGLLEDQAMVVGKSAQLVQGILQIALARSWLQPALNCMVLSQYLVQAMWDHQPPLLQLPHIDSAIVKSCKSRRHPVRTIEDLLDLREEERRAILGHLPPRDYSNLLRVAATYPTIRVESVIFKVLGQDAITPGCVITCQVRLSLEYPKITEEGGKGEVEEGENQKETETEKEKTEAGVETEKSGLLSGGGQENEVETFEFDEDGNLIDEPTKKAADALSTSCKPVHCPYFPKAKRPFWWVLLANRTNTNLVAGPTKIFDLMDHKTITLQFPGPPKALPITLNLHVKSDAVVGVDVEKEVRFTVVPPQKAPAESEEEWDISGDEDSQKVSFGQDD